MLFYPFLFPFCLDFESTLKRITEKAFQDKHFFLEKKRECYNGGMKLDEYIVVSRLINRTQGATIEEMSKALGKTERSVFNILREIDNLLMIYTDPDPDNPRRLRYKSNGSSIAFLPTMDFSKQDKTIFQMISSGEDIAPGLKTDANRLFNKLKFMAAERGALLAAGTNKPIPIMNTKSLLAKDVDDKKTSDTVQSFVHAIENKAWLDVSYKRAKGSDFYTWTIFPLVVFVADRNIYSYIVNREGALRTLAIERVHAVKREFNAPQPEGVFRIEEYFNDPFGPYIDHEPYEITILVDEEQALYEKSKKWPSCVFLEEQDGKLLLRTITRNRFHAKKFVLSSIPHMKVLSPIWMRDEIINDIEAGLESFKSD